MRALLNQAVPELEMIACFPENTWFGIGLGTHKMKNAELVFFMAPTDPALHKIVSTKVSKATRPSKFPVDTPFYKRTISTCGSGMI